MDISIVIINYNGNELLRQCLRSLKEYTTGLSYEIIVADNGSTTENIDEVLYEHPDVICVKNHGNLGFAAANNIGVERATGKYLLLLNNDTIFVENTLHTLFEYSEREITQRIIGCKLLNSDGSLQISTEDMDGILNTIGEKFYLGALWKNSRRLNKYHLNYNAGTLPCPTDAIKGAFMFMPATVYRELGGMDTHFFFYGEEIDFCYRAKKAGILIEYFPASRIIHLGGATTESTPWFMFQNLHKAKLKMYKKHYSTVQRAALTILHYLGVALRIGVFFSIGVIKMKPAYLVRSGYFMKLLFMGPGGK